MSIVNKPIVATAPWTLVGAGVPSAVTLNFVATGSWSFNPGQPLCDANGARNLSTSGRGEYPLHSAAGFEGELIGRIVNTRNSSDVLQGPFAIGTNASIYIPVGGELQVTINDVQDGSHGPGLADNSGQLSLQVSW